MSLELDEATDDTTTTDDSADETATSASPADDALSSAESSTEEGDGAAEQPEETPEQKAEREKKARNDARIAAAEKAEKAAEERRKARTRQLEEQEREERVRARETELGQRLQKAQSLIDDLEKRREAVLRGGYDGLKALGIDYGDWTKQTLAETSPDAVAQRALQEAKQLREELRRREEEENRRTQAKQEAEARAAAQQKFEAFVEQNAEDFPHAATLTSRMTHILAAEAAEEYYREHRAWPSFSALLPRLDTKAKAFHDELKTKGAKRARPGDTPSDGANATPQAASPGHPASPPANRTLTPANAVTKARPPRTMTPEEEDEWALAELRQAMQADAKQAKA